MIGNRVRLSLGLSSSLARSWAICLTAVLMTLPVPRSASGAPTEPRPAKVTPTSGKKTLLGNTDHHGWTVAPEVTYTTIRSNDGLLLGLKGGWILDHNLVLGAAVHSLVIDGFGIANTLNTGNTRLTYYGAYVEYIFNPESLLHFSVSGLFGGGSVNRNFVLIAQPAVNAIVNVSPSIHLGANFGYRFAQPLAANTPSSNAVPGITLGMFLQFGDF